MLFLFETHATMKDYNAAKWWIDRDYIPTKKINANNLKEAIKQYADFCSEHGADISANAIKSAATLYYDDKDGNAHECGRVFTASTEMADDDRNKWVKQYIDLWVNISIITSPFEQRAAA